MSSDAVHRPDDLSLCHQIIDEQRSTIDQLQRELTQAKHFVEQLLRSRYGPRSERFAPNQLSMFDARDSDDCWNESTASPRTNGSYLARGWPTVIAGLSILAPVASSPYFGFLINPYGRVEKVGSVST
jgi:hypothetical protein